MSHGLGLLWEVGQGRSMQGWLFPDKIMLIWGTDPGISINPYAGRLCGMAGEPMCPWGAGLCSCQSPACSIRMVAQSGLSIPYLWLWLFLLARLDKYFHRNDSVCRDCHRSDSAAEERGRSLEAENPCVAESLLGSQLKKN